ncbi:hypothetical protein BU17DRAFT_101520 [Hysterangium stoloniferum]|nr:hypothetical protein BU17DRAFT_101520 [Hysterangium stoloniferum]
MTYPSQQHILLPSNDSGPLIGLSEHNEQITNGGVLKIHPNVADVAPNCDRNTPTCNGTGPILNTVSYERLLFVGSVAHRMSSQNTSHPPSGPQPGMFTDLPQGMVDNYSILHGASDNLSTPLPGLVTNEYSPGDYSVSLISGTDSYNNTMDDYTELGHANSSVAESLPDLQGITDYSTVESTESLPDLQGITDIQDSATVAAASKAAIPVSTPSGTSPRNGGPPMQNHTIARIPSRCPSKEYHELYLRNKSCSCGLRPKSRTSKGEKAFMCIECGVAFTTRKNGIRHARNAKKIHECPSCHEFFARIDYRNSHRKFCTGKNGQRFSRGV